MVNLKGSFIDTYGRGRQTYAWKVLLRMLKHQVLQEWSTELNILDLL